jgi:hypothetical protein
MVVEWPDIRQCRSGVGPALHDVVEARDPDDPAPVVELDRAIDKQLDAMTRVGCLQIGEVDTAAVFPVAENGDPSRRRGELSQERVERGKVCGPIDRIAEFKAIELAIGGASLQQIRWPPTNA